MKIYILLWDYGAAWYDNLDSVYEHVGCNESDIERRLAEREMVLRVVDVSESEYRSLR